MDPTTAANAKLQAIAEKLGVTPRQVRDVILNNQVLIPDVTYRSIISTLIEEGKGIFDCLIFRSEKTQRIPARLTNDYVGNVIKGMNDAAVDSPYRVSYHVGNRDGITPELYDALLQKYAHSGLISIIPHNLELVAEACQRHQRPCILINFQGERTFEDEYFINVSNRQSIQNAVRHLVELGHRRIAFISGMMVMSSASERLKGYKDGLMENGLNYEPDLVAEGDWSSDKARELTHTLLKLADRPTAIIASNDIMASGAIIAGRECGLQIPNDLSVIGFDDIPMAEDIELTTIRQPLTTIGIQSFQLMTALLDGQKIGQHEYELPADLIIRVTTGHAPN